MNMITVQELARVLAERKKLEESVARSFVSTMFDVVRVALERDKLVKVKGLGTFKLIEVSARESVNVNSGERMLIGSYGKITFTPDSIMKEIVNKPFSQFETVVLNDGVEFDDIEQQGSEPVPEPAVESDGDISEGYADSDA
ncbi:MAG: HU family DNA-binding protein, partial [Prevotella sp.]|nr:HU family DNA-binding protein [Prevotella sp.]